MAKRLVARVVARSDVREARDHYLREAGERTALGFIDALRAAYEAIADFPQSGSNRYAHELRLPGLRSRKLTGYPYLIFYLERPDHVEIWRVLHAQREIPKDLSGEPSGE